MESRKRISEGVTFQSLALGMGIQKSYLSQVMKGKANLNIDQAYLLAEHLGMSDSESQYFFLLIEIERSGVAARKKQLKLQAKQIQSEQLKTENKIKTNVADLPSVEQHQYYLNPSIQLIHIALSIPKYSSNPKLLSVDLNFSESQVEEALQFLEKHGFISINASKIVKEPVNAHLPPSSEIYPAWKNQVRLMAQNKTVLNDPSNYQFSVFFTSNEAARSRIQAILLEAIESIQKEVQTSEPENLYQMNMDLIGWL